MASLRSMVPSADADANTAATTPAATATPTSATAMVAFAGQGWVRP